MKENAIIITPCFNESQVIIEFLDSLERTLNKVSTHFFEVVIVNDGSYDNTLNVLKKYQFNNDEIKLTVLDLTFNLGHQGAILQGLLYASELKSDQFIIMDSDGQDDPSVIPTMLRQSEDILFVKRGKRQESYLFIFFYKIYKIIFRLLIGNVIDFGNYCMINKKVVVNTLFKGFIHFPSFLSKQKFNKRLIIADRHKRLGGKSKMSFSELLQHALNSFIEYAEELLVICMKFFIVLSVILVVFACYVLYEKIFTDKAILGWASTIILGLFNGVIILMGTFVSGTLLLRVSQSKKGQPVQKLYKKVIR